MRQASPSPRPAAIEWRREVAGRWRSGQLPASFCQAGCIGLGMPTVCRRAISERCSEWPARHGRHSLTGICQRQFVAFCSTIRRSAPKSLTASLANSPSSTLRLRLRTRSQNAGRSTAQSCWLQFGPTCLREDGLPYFRRSWTLATRVSCFRHGCQLRDRCPSCGLSLAPFRQARLVPQQYCAFCDAPLTKLTGPASAGARHLERLIDDLLPLDSAGRAQDDRKSLAGQLMKHPVPVGTAISTIPFLSHRVRYDFFRRLSERQIEVRDPTERGPLTFWLGLARASENQKGLVRTLRDRLGETAGPGPASSSREPDLAALLRAAIQLHQRRRFPAEARQVA